MLINILRLCLITLFCYQANASEEKIENNQMKVNIPLKDQIRVGYPMPNLYAPKKSGPMTDIGVREELINLKKELHQLKNNSYPVGFVNVFAGITSPEGWLICDGQSYGIQQFQNLYKVINHNFGISENNMTFRVPDLRGQINNGSDHSNQLLYVIKY